MTLPLRPLLAALSLGLAAMAAHPPPPVLDKQAQLDAQTFWDNRDWDWYKANIPFFECPDADIVTTYYYRWELVTKHRTYGSPNSGYSFTEFTDRPFWSGMYGAISCPVGHQLYELRWLADDTYARDYSRYWFRTPGAQPRNYGCWLADGVWAMHQVHPNDTFMRDLLPDLKKNHAEWEKRQFERDAGMFWQNGHDDGMEFNINSRQTKDILRGAPGYRPGFNAYMWADANAIARTARLAGDTATAAEFEAKARGIKDQLQAKLWDPKREFFFPMSMRDEEDKEGNKMLKHTLTYQSGKYAGSPHGRELHGYIPWQFNLPDPGFESAWKFLMDPAYFYAPYGPTTVERNDPQFLLKNSCCWWSGQSWPYASAQTLKAMANLLQNYKQNAVSRADYAKLLRIFAISHRKNGKPYLAEALHPDTGSFDGHDGYNHSEHYFHSSFNDLVITGLVGLKTRDDETVEIDPLAPTDWNWFALEGIPYRNRRLTILWDRDGSRYQRGVGLRLLADGNEVGSRPDLGLLRVDLGRKEIPPRETAAWNTNQPELHWMNVAVNNDGDYYPRLTASFTAPKTSLDKVNDGHYWYTIHPPNRWTTAGSTNRTDWLEIDYGVPRAIEAVKLFFLEDEKEIRAPADYRIEVREGAEWKPVQAEFRHQGKAVGHRANLVNIRKVEAKGLRVFFTHAEGAFTGLTEIETWGHGERPYLPPPPKPGNLAYNLRGEGYPKVSASFHDVFGGVPRNAIDGRMNYKPTPVNRWTSYGSTNAVDWLEIDFGEAKAFNRVEAYLYDDRGGVQPPVSLTVQVPGADGWTPVPNLRATPAEPMGSAINTLRFDTVTAPKVRVLFTNRAKSRSGVTELEVWKD